MECLRRGRGRLQFFEHLDEEMRGMGEDEWEQAKQSSTPDAAWQLFGNATRQALRKSFGKADQQ
eukprot:6749342-Pyramimonas_sp.AAC.1